MCEAVGKYWKDEDEPSAAPETVSTLDEKAEAIGAWKQSA